MKNLSIYQIGLFFMAGFPWIVDGLAQVSSVIIQARFYKNHFQKNLKIYCIRA